MQSHVKHWFDVCTLSLTILDLIYLLSLGELFYRISFGYSAGDFFTAVALIVKVGSALNDSVGSAQEYRHVKTELDNLRTALEQVANLEPVSGLEGTVFAIKATAATCQAPLREFLEHIQRYDATLGKARSSGVMKDVAYRVRWLATKKAEQVAKLRAELGGYVGSLNMLIGLYQMFESRAECDYTH